MIKKIFISLLFILLLINISSASLQYINVNITNDGYTSNILPSLVSKFSEFYSDRLFVNNAGIYSSQNRVSYIDLGETPIISGYNILDKKVYLIISDSVPCYYNYNNIYNTSMFDDNTLNYTNAPNVGNFISSQNGVNGVSIPLNYRYIVIENLHLIGCGSYTGFYSSRITNPNLQPYVNYTFESDRLIYGYTNFIDINNISYILPNATILLNSTINTTSNNFGYYQFINTISGIYNISTSYNNAMNIENKIINYSNSSDLSLNFTLNYSHPYISTPYQENNYIKGKYSNNIKSMTLWNNPNYVWGLYNYTDTNNKYVKPCVYSGNNNIFICDYIPNINYSFQFQYSDIYNYDLNTYHPFLTGERDFFSNKLYVYKNNIISESQLSKQEPKIRENTLKTFDFNIVYILFIFIIFVMMLGFSRKDRKIVIKRGK